MSVRTEALTASEVRFRAGQFSWQTDLGPAMVRGYPTYLAVVNASAVDVRLNLVAAADRGRSTP